MVRFYGFNMEDIAKMTLVEFESYYQNIDTLQAQEALFAFQSADYPHLKEDSRNKFYKQVRKQAFPWEKQKVVQLDDIERVFNGK